MQDAHPALIALLAHLDEFIRRALKPGRHHAPVVVPDGAETVPHERVTPNGPILDQVADGAPVIDFASTHAVLAPLICNRDGRFSEAKALLASCEPAWPRGALFPHGRAAAIQGRSNT